MSFVVACVLLVQSGTEAKAVGRGRGGERKGEKQELKAEIQELIANITATCGEKYVDQLMEELDDEWSELSGRRPKENSKSSSEEDDDDDDDDDEVEEVRQKRSGGRGGNKKNSWKYLTFHRDYLEENQACPEFTTEVDDTDVTVTK
ncbi:uncharacterized protein [Watersipora subatra]|uniref:uncharacterized protein isoform X2 n=1 Tax=Watersipora subatra TaxID=2589382 RepID=UPI00355C7EB5